MPQQRSPICPPGTIAITMLIVLVILQLVVVGIVMAGGRDHDLTSQRTDSVRALYVAEAGINMAIRESVNSVDYDADGTVGTIATKTIGTATTLVTEAGAGSVTLTSVGSSGVCRSKASAVLSAPGNTLNRPIIYGDSTVTPKYRSWVSGAWAAAMPTSALDNPTTTMVVRVCPTRNEFIGAVDNNGGNPVAMIFDGANWTHVIEISDSNLTYRSYYVAYEQQSGKGLMACWNGGGGTEPKYRTWNGTSWSSSQSSSVSANNHPNWIRLVPRKNSNEIIMLCMDSNATLRASVWNGSAWTNTTTLAAGVSSATTEAFDGAYEGTSGRFLACWGGGGATLWDGAAWVAAAAPPNAAATTRWVRVAGSSASNSIITVMLDSASNVKMSTWDGAAWTASTTWTTTASNVDRRCFDVAFEPGGFRALAVYSRAANTPFYRSFDGTTWSAEQAGPDIASPSNFIQLMPDTGQQILAGFYRRSDKALMALKWTGASLTGLQTLTANMGGTGTTELFMIGDHPFSSRRVASWVLVQP